MDLSCCDGDDPMDVDIKEEPMPFPHVVDGKMETWLLDINKQDKTTLKDWCRGFGLHYSGNKKALKNELRKFSRNQAAWDRILPGARRMHRGPRIGSKRTSKKLSVSLAENLFPGQQQQAVPCALAIAMLPTQAAQLAALQVINGKGDLDWVRTHQADNILKRFPHMDKPARDAYRAQAAGQHNTSALNDTINSGFDEIKAIIKGPYQHLLPILLASTSTPPRYSATSTTSELEPPENVQEESQASEAMTTSLPEARTLTLGNSTALTFTPDDVPFPPAPTFADDLPRLNRMWDDTSTDWDGQSALHIKDIPIAIVYWPFVYASSKVDGPWKSRQWNVLKSRHSEWKYIVQRWREGSEADFWKEFSDSTGTRMNYTAIITRLKTLRVEENDQLTEQAKEEYGDHFASTFVYKKNGKVHVMCKPADIARMYRKLQGLT
ncbi:hypothetical protein BYT27DRAFT_7092465 [Phlegmacium glaucopus]|nr:hypothetical protein BYT27DRAFT_7092465 [Phlegmacium glaucopus]